MQHGSIFQNHRTSCNVNKLQERQDMGVADQMDGIDEITKKPVYAPSHSI